MRVFIGIALSNQTKEALYGLQRKWLENAIKKNPTNFANFHLTIKFIGELTLNQIETLFWSLKNELSHFKNFNMQIADVGAFFKGDKQIIWAGITEGKNKLNNLAKLVNKAILNAEIKVNKQKFSPHITLAREVIFNQKTNTLPLISITEHVTKLTIFRSQRIGGSLVYSSLYEIDLL